jgi:hypothetical protein
MRNSPETAPGAEPRWSLYPEEWRAARERVALLPSAPQRRLFWALLAHLERGWKIILPLQAASTQIVCGPGLRGPTAEDVAAFIECDPIDVYRGIAHACMHAIPSTPQGPRQGSFAIVADEAGDVARYLRILALGTDHPEFPPELRELVRAAAVEMTAWQAELAEVLEPVEHCAFPPMGALRVVG